MMTRKLFWILIGVATLSTTAWAGAFEDSVRARWRGAWVLLEIESYSNCSGSYFNNFVSGQFVTARGGRRFDRGELAKVNKVQVKRKKAELMVTVAGKVLVPWQDGPFTLYQQRRCAIELEVAVPRRVVKSKNVDAVDRALAAVAVRFATEEDAKDSADWNDREDDEFPADYELTLARHARWKAEQANLAIDHKIEVSLEEVERVAAQVEDDPGYLAGFVAGTHEMREWNEHHCGALVSRGFPAFKQAAPEEHAEDETWCEGYYDGQRLVYSILVARRLPACYVELPPVPEEDAYVRRSAAD